MIRPLTALITLLAISSVSAQDSKAVTSPVLSPTVKPWDQRYVDLEAGYLWKVGGSTTQDYGMLPVMLTYRGPRVIGYDFASGSKLIVRNRLSLLAQWVETGPENHYFGLMGAPSIEWWNAAGTWSLFGGIGGGIGLIDSQGVTGGQGRDLTLNWFGTVGVAHAINDHLQFRVGAMFQHLSNGGATNPNPGVNSLGFTTGMSWAF